MWPVFICFLLRRRRALYSPPHDSSSLNSKEQKYQDLSVTWLTILWELARQFISPTSYSQELWNCFVWKVWGQEGKLNFHNYMKYSVRLISFCQYTKIRFNYDKPYWNHLQYLSVKKQQQFFSCSIWKNIHLPTPQKSKTRHNKFWYFSFFLLAFQFHHSSPN